MTRPVDERIVSLQLNNSDFMRRAAETTTMFGRLRDTLNRIPGVNLGKTAKDLDNIQDAAAGKGVGRLAENVQLVADKFTTLGIVGVTALQNITNKAIDVGMNLAKSLTLDQVTAGFGEYETKIGSIGTVLSNTEWAGTSLDDVKRVLEELNVYADNTVYSFGQMTENIGRFTAAGVTIEDSATAIKGLSNLAAASGSNVNQLNTAMYQMSQSMAAGTFNLMDWNSLVNAGMGGKKTQDALLATAKAMGVNVDMSEGFRNSIQQGWLSSEVFLETMKKFGADESMTEAATAVRTFSGMMDSLKESIGSGWATTFEHIFGDFEEATTFWTDMSTAVTGFFAKSTESRNTMLEHLADKGAIGTAFGAISNIIESLGDVLGSVGEGFSKVFPPLTIQKVHDMINAFHTFTKGLKLSEETTGKLTTVFQGVFSVVDSAIFIVKELASAFLKLLPPGLGGGLLDLVTKIAELAIGFNKSLKEGNLLTDSIKVLGDVLGTIGRTVSDAVSNVYDFGASIRDNLAPAIDWIGKKLAPVKKWFSEAFGGFGGDDLLGAGTLVGIGLIVSKIIGIFDKFGDGYGSIVEALTDGIGGIVENVGGVFEGLGESLQAFVSQVKYNNLLKIAIAIGILAVSLKLMENMDTADITKGITALAITLGILMGGLALIEKFSLTGGIKASVTLIAMASAVLIMAGALRTIANLNPEELKTGLLGLAGIVATLSIAIIAMSKFGGKMKTSSLQLIALAGAVTILAGAVKEMSTIPTGDLVKGVLALTGIFAGLAIFLKVVDKTKFGMGSALAILAISGAVHVMVSAIQKIAKIDGGKLTKGLVVIGLILAEVALFSKLASGGNLIVASAGLMIMAAAIENLVGPIQTFGGMKLEDLAKGLGTMALALVAMAGAGILATGSIGGAVAIGIMALALQLIVNPLLALSKLTWTELLKGFVGLGGGMALVAGAALLLSPAIPSMLGFGAALAVIGVAVLAAGAGIALFGVGLTTLATLTAVSVGALVSAFGILMKGLIETIPAAVEFVVKLGAALIEGALQLIPALAEAVVTIIISVLTTIDTHLPRFIEVGSSIIIKLMQGIGEYVPKLVEAGIKMIIDFINGLSDAIENNGPELINAVMRLLGEIIILFVQAGIGIIDALLGWIPGVKKATAAIGETAEEYIRENFGAEEVAKEKGDEFVLGLEERGTDLKKVGADLSKAAEEGMLSVDLSKAGKTAGSKFAEGIANSDSVVRKSATNLGAGVEDALNRRMGIQSPSKVTTKQGEWTGQGYANGINSKKKETTDAATALADAAKKAFDASKDWIDDRKYYNELSLTEELAAWERIQNRYKTGSDERTKADKEVYRLKNEINKQLISINDEYVAKIQEANKRLEDSERSLTDNYLNTVNQRAQSLVSFAGIFDEVNRNFEVSGGQLMENLRGQVAVFDEWSTNIEALGERGLDVDLLAELQEMGPQSADQIAALTTLTDEQLSEYALLWRTKHELAHQQATTELEGLRLDTAEQITLLREETAVELEGYKEEWIQKISELKTGTKDEFVGLNSDMRSIGNNVMQGLSNGLTDMTPALLDQARAIANAISSTIATALQIHSPSRVMQRLGQFAIQGLVNGMGDGKSSVEKTAEDVAKTAVASVQEFMSDMENNNELHFKAVVDYDSIDTSKFKMATKSLLPDTSFTKNVANDVASGAQTQSSSANVPTTTDNSKNFNPVVQVSAGAGPREIARETSKSLRKLAYQFGV